MEHRTPRDQDDPTQQRARDRHHGGLLGWSALLFLCLFLPAVDGCDNEVYPVQFLFEPGFWSILILPHLMSIPLALLAAGDRERDDGLPAGHGWLVMLVILTYAGTALLFIQPLTDGDLWILAPAAAWALPLPALIRTLFSRRLTRDQRAARWRWLAGLGMFAYFFMWFAIAGVDESHSGLYLSMLACLGIAHAGHRLERTLPDAEPPLPEARVRRA
jgi:hypothetical protein